MATITAPLFPLGTVLFPGGPLALRIFEPRYLGMIRGCLQSSQCFGVALIAQGSEVGIAQTRAIGTLAEIVDWYPASNGLLGVTVHGRERFRLRRSTRQRDGLYVGEVELLAAEPEVALPDEDRELASLLKPVLLSLGKLYEKVPRAYEDASWVGYRLAETLPLPSATKQALLEMDDAMERLDILRPCVTAHWRRDAN